MFRTCKDCLKWSEDLQSNLKFLSDGYSDKRILKGAWGRGIRDEDDKGCYDQEGEQYTKKLVTFSLSSD
jgi:hypothetical protein